MNSHVNYKAFRFDFFGLQNANSSYLIYRDALRYMFVIRNIILKSLRYRSFEAELLRDRNDIRRQV